MSQENVELFRRAVEASNDGDLDAFLHFADSEITAATFHPGPREPTP